MLNVFYVECRYTECHYAECRYDECHVPCKVNTLQYSKINYSGKTFIVQAFESREKSNCWKLSSSCLTSSLQKKKVRVNPKALANAINTLRS
jgi:hypothetical protein